MFPKKLLLCVDSVEHFDKCKTEAGWIARHLGAGLVLFHSAPEKWLDAGPTLEDTEVEENWLDALVDDPALVNIEVEARSTAGFNGLIDSIFEACRDTGCDVVLVPTHARSGLDHMLFGSVAERVLRSCRFPVMTLDLEKVPTDKGDAAFDRVVCPIDFSDASRGALEQGAAIAMKLGIGVTAMHAIDDYFAAAYPIDGIPSLDVYLPSLIDDVAAKMKDLASKLAADNGIEADAVTEVGSFVNTVKDCVDNYKNPLIVMSTSGRDSLGDHVLGSRTERIVRSAHVPVLALPPGFKANS